MNPAVELDVLRCELDGIHVIEASAGTGKTWNICGLYLRLLLERGLAVQQILVVTFTNAATAELRERIRGRIAETLQQLQDHAESSPLPQLTTQITAQIQRLDLALQTFDEASIFTIHGFCQRALADAPFAAGLPLSVELLPDDSELVAEVTHDFWRRHLAGDTLSAELAAFLIERGDTPDRYARLLRRHLSKPLARQCWPKNIEAVPSIERLKVDAEYTVARALWHAQADEICALLVHNIAQLNGRSYTESALEAGRREWDALFAANDALAPVDFAKGKLHLFCSTVLATTGKKKNCTPPAHRFFDLADNYLTLREQMASELTAARLRLIRTLFTEAGRDLRERKRARRVAGFDDMLFNLYERLTGGECPWLGAALQARFPAALIDEFQDTDPLQFETFRAIYGKAATPGCSLFLVGDPKQAIYSFRHADLHTYLRAKAEAGAEYSLTANQRASAGLIAAVNRLFGTNDRAFVLNGLDYREVSFGSKPRAVFADHGATRADLQVWMLPTAADGLLDKPQARATAAAATATEIVRLIDSASVSLAGRPLRAGDIAVLVRSHTQGSEMKQALARLNVGSVELSQASVLRTPEAEELERVLLAVLDPLRDALVRAALATELFGRDAAAVDALMHNDARMDEDTRRFLDYRDLWLRRGVGVMVRKLLADEHASARMLARDDGERRLTNLLHLGEMLHQAAELHASPEALLRWFQTQRRDESRDDSAQLRLESDRNLVQIVTIHKAKGLEYPVVFCPFLWDGRIASGGKGLEGRSYHDAAGNVVVDFRGDDMDADELAAVKDTIRHEESAEQVRLIYVALTRAAQRCYLVAGGYTVSAFGNLSATEGNRSLLNWLVAGQGMSPAQWFKSTQTADDIHAAWCALPVSSGDTSMAVVPLPSVAGKPVAADNVDPDRLAALVPPLIPAAWRISSYSGLSHGAIHEQAARDHDARSRAQGSPVLSTVFSAALLAAPLDADDIFRFPRGAAAGDCLHAMFERMDFARPDTWAPAAEFALEAHPQSLPGVPAALARERLRAMLARLAADVTATELMPGLRLDTVRFDRRLVEMEFNLPVPQLTAGELNRALKAFGYVVPRLSFGSLQGFLKGFIDLVFEHEGRFYILDWKSNHLGNRMDDYFAAPVQEAMAGHGYHLQYLLYAVALDRYLRQRIVDYCYDTHFGSVLYLFVRGVRPGWRAPDGKAAGVYAHRPDEAAITRLNRLLECDTGEGA